VVVVLVIVKFREERRYRDWSPSSEERGMVVVMSDELPGEREVVLVSLLEPLEPPEEELVEECFVPSPIPRPSANARTTTATSPPRMIILLRLPLPADADPCVPYPTAGNSPPVTGGFGSVVDAAAERS
jgi:hypothetical protein